MDNIDVDETRTVGEVNGTPDTVDMHGRTLMHVAIRCLRPGTRSIIGLEDDMVDLCTQGYGLPIGVGWWIGDNGALDTVSVPRDWTEDEWRRFVQTNWPRVIDFDFMTENRGGRLRLTHTETLNTQEGEVLYILPTSVRLHQEGAFVQDGVRRANGLQRLIRDVFMSLDPLDERLWDNWYWADGSLWIRSNGAMFVPMRRGDWYISDGEIYFRRKKMIIYLATSQAEVQEVMMDGSDVSLIADTEYADDDRVDGEMVELDIPRMWEEKIDITFYGTTFETVTRSFRKNEKIKAVVGFVRSLQGARAAFEVYRMQVPILTNECERDVLIGICFQTDIEVHVMWGKNYRRGETGSQRQVRGLYRDIRHAMVPVAQHTNHLDFFLANAWESFQGRDRNTFRISPSMVVTLKTRTQSGEVVDIGGYDYGGPSRAAMSRLMEGVEELPIMTGGKGDKILQFNTADYLAGTYGDVGEGLGLILACGGSAPTFIGPVMSRVLTEGYRSMVQCLDRKDCEERGYIRQDVSREIEKVENASVETVEEVLRKCPLMGGWGPLSIPSNNAEIDVLAKWILYNEVVGRHHLAYEQMICGMGRIYPMITRTPANQAGFRALCQRGNLITLMEFIERCEFHGPFHEGGTNEGTDRERRLAHGWLRRYVMELEGNRIEGVTVADLHEAITGQPMLVTTGREEDMILNIGTQINDEEGGQTIGPRRLTKFVTCGTLMLIQLPCDSYQTFKERTSEAILLSSPLHIIDRADRVFRMAVDE